LARFDRAQKYRSDDEETDMTQMNEGGNKETHRVLQRRPTLDEATSGRLTVVTGHVFRSAEGKVAVTMADGQIREFEAAAVDRHGASFGE
jgi:hypothetical protein